MFEKNKLKSILGDNLYKHLKKHEMIVAGGTITSLFTGNPINDIDVYSRSNEDSLNFAEDYLLDNFIVSHTAKATQVLDGELPVQLIHYRTFNNVEDIYSSFDFTVCSGAFDFKTEEFILHEDFLKHNSQRVLRFNSNTDYPIISALRVQKYEDKGYKISKAEFIRIILSCMLLEIKTYGDLKDQLGGMYQESYENLFKDVSDDDELDLQEALDSLTDITLSEDYFNVQDKELPSTEEILEDIDKSEKVIFSHKDKKYRVLDNGKIYEYAGKGKDIKEISFDEAIKFDKLYKFVEGKEDSKTFNSFHYNDFTYTLNEEVVASDKGYKDGKLYFTTKDNIESSNFRNSRNTVMIECSFKNEDLIDIETDNHITVKKVFVERVVPKEEWSEWLKKEEVYGVNLDNFL